MDNQYYPPSDIGHVSFSGLSEPCSIGSVVEVVINAHGDSATGSVIVEAVAPSGRLKKCQVLQKANLFTATFTPNEVGKWQIGILYDGEHIRGSPFSCYVYDANLVQVYGLDVGLVGQELKFSVNAAQAGEGVVKVSVLRHGRSIPCEVYEQVNSGVYRVSFTPDGAGQYKIHVLFNNMEVKGSPFILDIADASSVSVYGENLRMASVDRLSQFMIHAVGAECKDITVTITAPSGKTKHARVIQVDDVSYKVEWKAVEAGEHSIDVRLFNQSVYESPFICNVGDPDLVTVRKMPEYIRHEDLYKDLTFEIDASAAGSGNLEIMINGGRVACRVRELGGRQYLAVFTPTQSITHVVEMRFNGESVRLSPWKIQYVQTSESRYEERRSKSVESSRSPQRKESYYSELKGLGLQRAPVGRLSTFEITGDGLDASDVHAILYGPDVAEIPIRIYHSGKKLICEYVIKQVGEHRLEMTICGKKVEPYPLIVSGYCTEKVKIEPLGGGAPGQPVQFIVDAVDAGKGQLEISVNQGRVPNNVQMQGAGRCLVTFIPQYPGKYVIDVTFNGEQVHGCPIRVDILPKQVGQSITTPVISHQTSTITSTVHKAGSLVRPPDERIGSPTSPTLIRHLKQPSSDQPSPAHPVSPVLLQKVDQRNDSRSGLLSTRWESSSRQSASPRPWASSLTRLSSKSPAGESDSERRSRGESLDRSRRYGTRDFVSGTSDGDRDVLHSAARDDSGVGYTVAQYGGGKPHTVCSRTLVDDGRGTVTSTFTSETRYNSVSPSRTYEYSRGTVSSLSDEGRGTMPTSYSETRSFDLPKVSPRAAVEPQSSQTDYKPCPVPLPPKDYDQSSAAKKKLTESADYSSGGFVTDSRSYGFGPGQSRSEGALDSSHIVRQYGFRGNQGATPPSSSRYFGDKAPEADSGAGKTDVGMITTTYEKYRSTSRENIPEVNRYGALDSTSSTSYSTSVFDQSKTVPSNGHLKQDDTAKDSVYSTSSFGTFERRTDEPRGGSCDKLPPLPPPPPEEQYQTLEKSKDLAPSPKNWKDFSEVEREKREREKRAEAEKYQRDQEMKREADKRAEADAYRREQEARREAEEKAEAEAVQSQREADTKKREWPPSHEAATGKYAETVPAAGVRRAQWHANSAHYASEAIDHDVGPSYLRTQSAKDARELRELVADQRLEYEKGPGDKPDHARAAEVLRRSEEVGQCALTTAAQRTAEFLRMKEEDDRYLERHGLAEPKSDRPSVSLKSSLEIDEAEHEIPAGVIEEALTPRTRRKLLEKNLRREEDLDESLELAKDGGMDIQTLDKEEQLPHSKPPSAAVTPKSTPKTTPKLSLKFSKEPKESKAFDFGKSKFTSKHEIVRKGKDVDVKLESLKLSKEDQLRVVVIPPSKGTEERQGIEPRVKKSRNNYEISFKPTEVGTHKVMAYVNGIVHPLSPFPIRVYDASEIIVGEITPQSTINDTVEFTVDAGRAGFGNLEMAIKDSEGVIIPSHVAQLESGTAKFLVTFNPTSVGMHTVNITFNKEVLKNSPFEVNIVEPKEPSVEAVGADTKKKESKKEREEKKREEKEKLKKEKEEKMESLKRSKEKESKKKKQNLEKKPSVSKIPSLSRVLKPAQIFVNVVGDEQLQVSVIDPAKKIIENEISDHENGVKKVQFTPVVVGDHEIDIKYGGIDVQGSPFTCRAYDPAKIVVASIPNGIIDKPVHFVVDASEAGVGNLEVAVNEGRVPSMAQSLGQHRYDISFVPREQEDHTISVRFNNEPVPGSPFLCHLVSTQSVTAMGAGLERIPVGQVSTFHVIVEGQRGKVPLVRITDSQGEQLPVSVTEDTDGRFSVEYTPKNVGNHQIEVEYDGEPITGSPFTSKAFDASCVHLTRVEDAQVGRACTFTIDAARAGAGNMEIIVSVENRNVPNFVQAEGQAKFKVSFTPQEPKDHIISVRFNGHAIPGSPMVCPVRDKSSTVVSTAQLHLQQTASPSSAADQQIRLVGELTTGQVGQVKGFSIDTAGRNTECNVIVTDSHGGPLPVRCYKQHDDSYWVEFTPEEIGTHKIEITFADVPVAGSPFKCEVVDPRKVIFKGTNEPLVLRQAANISVNRDLAGHGELTVDVTDPNGQPLKVEMLKSPSGEDKISFLPTRLGQYKLNARLAGFQVAGTPQTLIVEEQSKPSVYGSAVESVVEVDHSASVIFDPKKLKGGLKVDIKSPKKVKVRHTANKRSDGTTEILFTPTEVGRYIVNVEFNSRPVTGSPFGVEVVDPHKVIVNDETADENGVIRLAVQQRNIIDVDATAAGSGKLRAEVRDWDGKLVGGCDVDSLGYGKYRIIFNPQSPGKYNIYLYWAEIAVESAYPLHAVAEAEQPSTSRAVTVAATAAEAARHSRAKSSDDRGDRDRVTTDDGEIVEYLRVVLRGEGLSRAVVKEQAEFIIDASDTSREGRVTCMLIGQKADVPVRLTHIGNNVYKALYSPLIPGTYELQVLWDGRHVRGSPFRVQVDSHTSPAELIHVDTNTLKIGIINEDVKTVIDTRRAGPGQLSAQCMGPSKLAYCELYDHRDGTYTLSVRPSEVGKHTLVVKYSDEHVPGSPFIINVSHQPDASKVRVYGPGIEHGILSTFKSNFVVETKGAGAGQLTVRVRGPKGAFNVEMQREKKQERTIHCKYEPREPGDYQVEVKWHGEHVPGSPYLVMIVDTEQELQRFLRGDAPSPQPATPFIPPGWIGAPPPPLFVGGGPPPRGPFPPPHTALPPPHGPHPPMIPYGPPPPRVMRAGVRSRYANGY